MRQLALALCSVAALACSSSDKSIESDEPSTADEADDDRPANGGGKTGPDAGRSTGGTRAPRGGGDDEAPIARGGDDDEDESVCDAVTIQARPNAPEILIVLDRSGSMVGVGAQGGAMVNRWEPSANAVKKLTSDLAGVASFGLMLFPAPGAPGMGGGIPGLGAIPGLDQLIPGIGMIPGLGGGGGSCTAGMLNVPVGANNAPMIAMALDGARPDIGATPTAGTLENAYGVLSKSSCADCQDVPKFVLLVTDGQPNCGASGTMTSPADIEASNAALDKLRESGIRTYVIGYDMASDPTSSGIMEQFAQHGGTDKFIPVENETELSDNLRRIAGSLISCEYDLNEAVENPALVRVIIDGDELVLNQGWTIEDRKITLTEGADGACPRIRDGRLHTVKIQKDCEEQIFQ